MSETILPLREKEVKTKGRPGQNFKNIGAVLGHNYWVDIDSPLLTLLWIYVRETSANWREGSKDRGTAWPEL
jgi:hypothetical protein